MEERTRSSGAPPSVDVSRETLDRLDSYFSLLTKWNSSLNLVSRGDIAPTLRSRHIAESLELARYLPPQTKRFIDLGSGGGLPAIPIALATGRTVDLIEADQRKAAFLVNAMARLAIPGDVWNQRIEECAASPAMCVTARALASLPELLTLTAPLLSDGGAALFLKGARLEAELTAARLRWSFQAEIFEPWASGTRILRVSGLKAANGTAD